MKPRHADLLADLDRETDRWIDRFMMFYVTSADKLQRTAGLARQSGGASTTCAKRLSTTSWTGRDAGTRYPGPYRQFEVNGRAPSTKRKRQFQRFSHFINSDKRDPDVQFVAERDQHRPATASGRAHPLSTRSRWKPNDEIPPPTQRHPAGTGVCALIEGRQIAPVPARSAAMPRCSPSTTGILLRRQCAVAGLICEHDGELWVASP